MISIEQALALVYETTKPLPTETVRLGKSVTSFLADAISADVDSPPHNKSVMDGFAVRANDVKPSVVFNVLETIIAGDTPTKELAIGSASQIMTGAPLPTGADAVVMVERAELKEFDGKRTVSFDLHSIEPGKHVMSRAASFARGDEIFPAGHQIRPWDIGLLAEVGAHTVQVFARPTAMVIPTGNELVDASQTPGPGQIRNSNGPMLAELLRSLGADVNSPGIARDEVDELRAKIQQGLECDLLVLSGGVSAGTMDLVPKILQECGVKEVFHKVKVKPGKPIWFGVREFEGRHTYVFGLPGNPVSSLVGFHLFVRAALNRMAGVENLNPKTLRAKLSKSHQVRGDRPTWWPGRWVESQSCERIVEPLAWQGSSDLRSLCRAEVLICFPADHGNFAAGQEVQVSRL